MKYPKNLNVSSSSKDNDGPPDPANSCFFSGPSHGSILSGFPVVLLPFKSSTVFPVSFLCCLPALSLVICGCTSSGEPAAGPETGSGASPDTSQYAGTCTNTDDTETTFVLNTDGTFRHSNGVSSYFGTCSYENGDLRFCTAERDGTTWFSVPVEADGSFTNGYNTFRK